MSGINYKKLTLAHQLASKYTIGKAYHEIIYIMVGYTNIELRYSILLYKDGEQIPFAFPDGCEFTYEIDDLITQLQLLTTNNS